MLEMELVGTTSLLSELVQYTLEVELVKTETESLLPELIE